MGLEDEEVEKGEEIEANEEDRPNANDYGRVAIEVRELTLAETNGNESLSHANGDGEPEEGTNTLLLTNERY